MRLRSSGRSGDGQLQETFPEAGKKSFRQPTTGQKAMFGQAWMEAEKESAKERQKQSPGRPKKGEEKGQATLPDLFAESPTTGQKAMAGQTWREEERGKARDKAAAADRIHLWKRLHN